MAQAQIDRKKLELLETGNKRSIGIQTGTYYSSIYKENVMSFVLSNSKSFIINKDSFNALKEIFPIADRFFKNGN
jgi:hypothetical protein